MNVLSLFAGIGGFDLGLERAGMRVVAQCEFDPFCQKVLKKHWPDVPCYPDVRELTREVLIDDGIISDTESNGRRQEHTNDRGRTGGSGTKQGARSGGGSQGGAKTNATNPGPIDLICGGYPCQPFSHAGKREGAADDRHLWPEMHRLIETIRPRWVIAENVAGHISMGLDDVLADLEGSGYACWTFVIPACAVDARHRRDRVWIVADNDSCRPFRPRANGRQQDTRANGRDNITWGGRWPTEPSICRVAHGIPQRVDRLKALGNAVVPAVVQRIGEAIMESQ